MISLFLNRNVVDLIINLLVSTALGMVKHISGFNLHLKEKFSLHAWLTHITASTSLKTNLRTLFR